MDQASIPTLKLCKPAVHRLFLVLLIGLLLPVAAVWAKSTTDQQARQVVLKWLSLDQQPLGTPLGQQISGVQTFADDSGNPQYYVVYLNPAGFVIVPGDDLVEPIIGFVAQGTYDPSPANPLGALVSRDVPGRLAEVAGLMQAAPGQEFIPSGRQQEALLKWEFLQGNLLADALPMYSRLPEVSDVRVAPLVATKWSQEKDNADASPCYNYYTYWNSIYYPCGCVATAMAQVMRFWSWPQTAVGTASFDITVAAVPRKESLRGGDGSGGVYDWVNMINDPKADATITQRQAIGNLTHDAGVAVNMSYTTSVSNANLGKAAEALVKTFGYSPAKFGYNDWNIPLPNLYNMINPNLDASSPVILGVAGLINGSGGHAIVCDGYGYNTFSLYHHLNLGWGGAEDAWYNLPTIDTSQNGTYKTVNSCVYNVYTSGTGEIISGRVVDANSNPLKGALVTLTLTSGSRTATSNSQGIYAFTKLPVASSCTISASLVGYKSFNTQEVSTGTSTDGEIICGNLWGIDFSGTKIKTIAPVLELLLN